MAGRRNEADAEAETAERRLPRLCVRELTRGGTAAELDLDGTRYVLSITRQGKLILTK